ncbi:MAG TPA: hypothetical protein VGK38_15520 [Prolixibacteraceae bacterium]
MQAKTAPTHASYIESKIAFLVAYGLQLFPPGKNKAGSYVRKVSRGFMSVPSGTKVR